MYTYGEQRTLHYISMAWELDEPTRMLKTLKNDPRERKYRSLFSHRKRWEHTAYRYTVQVTGDIYYTLDTHARPSATVAWIGNQEGYYVKLKDITHTPSAVPKSINQ